jgi:hypothetical protein
MDCGLSHIFGYRMNSVDITVKVKNQHSGQTNIHSFTSLHLYVLVSVDHHQGACGYRVQQLNNMCLRPSTRWFKYDRDKL